LPWTALISFVSSNFDLIMGKFTSAFGNSDG
jgi:hypothetical protein